MKLVTWNIWNGGEGRLEPIARVLHEQDADVVALQEANDRLAVEELGKRLGMDVVYGAANSVYAVAWLSRLPVRRVQNHRLPVLEKTLLEIDVGGLSLFTTHLSAGRSASDEPHRIVETQAVLSAAGATADLLVGDFNAVHPADGVGDAPPEENLEHVSRRPIELVLDAGFTDCFRARHPDERGWTYLAWHPWARIDFVFASERVDVARCDLVPNHGDASDHVPLVAEVQAAES